MTPQLRFPEFTDEWQVKKLGDLASKVGSGSTPRGGSAVYRADGVPFIRSQNVVRGRLEMSDIVFIDEVTHRSMLNSEIKPNDVLLNITGASLGRTCVVPKDFTSGNLNQHVCIIRLNDTSSHLVHIILSKPRSLHELLKTQTGGGKEGLNFQAVRSFKVALPSKPEQEKIADFLTAVDERIAVGEKKLELLETYKRGVMQKIFSQQIRFKEENGNPYPDWEEKKLGELVDIKSGSSKSEYIERNGANVIVDMGAISSDATLIDTKRTNFSGDFIETDELIMAKDDIGGGNIIGKVVMVPERNKFVLGDHVYKLSPHSVDTTFLYYAINSPAVNREFRKKANGTAQIGITNGTVTMQAIDVPCDDEQQKIANFLTTFDEKITAEKSKLTATRKFKKALLQRMFV